MLRSFLFILQKKVYATKDSLPLCLSNARGGSRTLTPYRGRDFKSLVSAIPPPALKLQKVEAALGFEPRIPDLQSAALVHLAMPPSYCVNKFSC